MAPPSGAGCRPLTALLQRDFGGRGNGASSDAWVVNPRRRSRVPYLWSGVCQAPLWDWRLSRIPSGVLASCAFAFGGFASGGAAFW
ncbi:hypothetical protein GCM10010404_08980 [Nonomuraea africana]